MEPTAFGYEFDLSLLDCTFHSKEDGSLEVRSPAGKKVGLVIEKNIIHSAAIRAKLDSLGYDGEACISRLPEILEALRNTIHASDELTDGQLDPRHGQSERDMSAELDSGRRLLSTLNPLVNEKKGL